MSDTTKFAGMGGEGPSDHSLQANTVLQRRYKILGVAGGGGMGTVYQARDLAFPDVRRLVAVKEMLYPNTDPALHSSTLQTFRREANILATLNHPAIPKIFDFFDQNDRVYLVMEFIHGSDLESLLVKTKELPIEKIIDWAIEMCDVVSYLHTQPKPIVFRDLKPSNIMIDNFGKVRLIDFGIAKIFDIGAKKHTMIGTEGYCAPEQYKGDVTILSDIYSLGATLHHVLTRKDPRLEPPFSFSERPIKDHNSKAPDGLIAIVEKALAFEPQNRYQSSADMKADLEKLRYQPQVVISVPKGGVTAGTDFFEGVTGSGTIEPKWTFKTEDEIRSSPVVYRDSVFVGSYDTNVYSINLATGAFGWKFATRGGIAASPIVDETNKLVMFGSEDQNFYAVDIRHGKISWSEATKDKIRCTARLARDVDAVFFGSDDGFMYARGTTTGRRLWEYEVGDPLRSRPCLFNDIVIFGTDTGEVLAIGLDGKPKWQRRIGRGAIVSSPYIHPGEGICYIGSTDGKVYALDAGTGFPSWRFATGGPVISSPVVEGELLLFGSTDGYLYAINAQTGKDRWKFKAEKAIIASPLIHQGVAYFGSADEYFYAVDIHTHKERWKFKTNGAITSTAVIAGDLILFGSMDKTLYALPLVG